MDKETLERTTASLLTKLILKEQSIKAQSEWINELTETLNKSRIAHHECQEELRIVKEKYQQREIEVRETTEKMKHDKETEVASVRQQAQNEIQNMIEKNLLLAPSQIEMAEIKSQMTAHKAAFELYKREVIMQQEELKQKTIQECTEHAKKDLENQQLKLSIEFSEHYAKMIQKLMTDHEVSLNEMKEKLEICKEKEDELTEKLENQEAEIEDFLERIAEFEAIVEEKESLIQEVQNELERLREETQEEIRTNVKEAIDSIKRNEYIQIAEHKQDIEDVEKKFVEEKSRLTDQIKDLKRRLKKAMDIIVKKTELKTNMDDLISDLDDLKDGIIPEPVNCTICEERPKNSFFIPCGHQYCCECANEIEVNGRGCAFCRVPVQSIGTLHN